MLLILRDTLADKGAVSLRTVFGHILKVFAVVAALGLGAVFVFFNRAALADLFVPSTSELVRVRLAEWVDSFGVWAIFVLFLVQLLQIVVAVVPGEPVEFAAGMLFGTLGGLAVCLCGILVGSFAVLALSRRYGRRFALRFFTAQSLDRYEALGKTKRFEAIALLLFFLPGTPKDVLLYAVGLTRITPGRFFFIAVVARIPSVVSSTLAGAAFGEGLFVRSGIIYLSAALLGAVGILVHHLLLQPREK